MTYCVNIYGSVTLCNTSFIEGLVLFIWVALCSYDFLNKPYLRYIFYMMTIIAA